MGDLQVFDMNPQLNFPIPDKSLYQMPFNSAPQPAVPSYVTETSNFTNHIQLLEILNNPQNPLIEDKKRQFFGDLMAPHYEKQTEIEKKIENLTETLNSFIQAQKAMNEMVLGKYLRENSPQTVEEPRTEEPADEEPPQTDLGQQQPINNPMPVYGVPIAQETRHSPIRNRSISPEKMETSSSGGGSGPPGMSVRDFLKNTMTMQRADDKILELERARDRDEAETTVKYNKFRVRNRPKKYKRSAVTFTVDATSAILESSTQSSASSSGGGAHPRDLRPPSTSSDGTTPCGGGGVAVEHEENVFQPIVVPCAQRGEIDLTLMQPMQPSSSTSSVFPPTASYVLNPPPTSHHHNTTLCTENKFPPDPNNLWKAVDNVSQLLVDAPSLLEYDVRSSITDHHHHHPHHHQSSFLPFGTNQEPLHPRSAFVPPILYQKDRRIQMDPNIGDSLRNL